MKAISRFLSISVLAAAVCVSLGFSVARADDDGDEQGGDIEGTESLDVEIAMTPTAAAPAGSAIKASLEAEDDEGTTNATLKLETQGLPAGTYFVNVTLKSDGSTVSLGSFTVGSSGQAEVEFTTQAGGDDQGDDNEQGDENDNGDEESAIPFPANFNPFDIATISVTDANNVVLFTADLTSVSAVASMNFNASVQATAGPGNPSAGGNAVLSAFVAGGAAKGMLQINGHGLSPSTPLMIAINGAKGKKATTDGTGNVSISLAPKGKTGSLAKGVNVFSVRSASIRDKFGNVLLSFSF